MLAKSRDQTTSNNSLQIHSLPTILSSHAGWATLHCNWPDDEGAWAWWPITVPGARVVHSSWIIALHDNVQSEPLFTSPAAAVAPMEFICAHHPPTWMGGPEFSRFVFAWPVISSKLMHCWPWVQLTALSVAAHDAMPPLGGWISKKCCHCFCCCCWTGAGKLLFTLQEN